MPARVRNDAIACRFGTNLRARRKRDRLTQEALAFRAGLHRTEIGLLEGGHRVPSIETLVKLACALEAPTDELLDGINWVLASEPSGGEFTIGGAR